MAQRDIRVSGRPHVPYGIRDHIREDLEQHPIRPARLLLGLIAFAIALVVIVLGLGAFLATGTYPN